jgi:enterochelin esterase-like enzyme
MGSRLDKHLDLASQYVTHRHVDVWLPPGYYENGTSCFPVLYLHDGQNLFDSTTSYSTVDWGVGKTMERLIAEDRVRETIVLAIWSTPQRLQEYLLRRPSEVSRWRVIKTWLNFRGPPKSDDYLKFIVEELKPFVDKSYRTKAGYENTFIMGSSMGGLISLYGMCEYPHVFAGTAYHSTYWPVVKGVMAGYLKENLPDPGTHKFYFDYGKGLWDRFYAPYQKQIDEVIRPAGYEEGKNWVTRKFEGADHSEKAWRERVYIPLEFILRSLTADSLEESRFDAAALI